MDSLKPLLLSFEGRINRARYWTGIVVIIVVEVIALAISAIIGFILGNNIVTTLIGILAMIVCVAMIWPSIALGVKRFHDRNKSGWWVLIAFVPVIGGLWYLIECGFLEGTKGPNQFGPDPLPAAA
jgi:uncharacterized membrane protein YhaH (DUF805 family)